MNAHTNPSKVSPGQALLYIDASSYTKIPRPCIPDPWSYIRSPIIPTNYYRKLSDPSWNIRRPRLTRPRDIRHAATHMSK